MKKFEWEIGSQEYEAEQFVNQRFGYLDEYEITHETITVFSSEKMMEIYNNLGQERKTLWDYANTLLMAWYANAFFGVDSIITCLLYVNSITLNMEVLRDEIRIKYKEEQDKNGTNC